jgi:hypothetical protein
MNKTLAHCICLLFAAIAFGAGTALADDNHTRRLLIDRDVDTFAVLPDGVALPEGITANPANGDIYVATFTAPSKLLRYNRHGRLLAQREFPAPLLGLEWDSARKKVYITSIGDFTGAPASNPRFSVSRRISPNWRTWR